MFDRLRQLNARQCLWWCAAGVALILLQPFLRAGSVQGRVDARALR